MNLRVLQIDDLDATDQSMVYACHGLGSCIGVFITDRRKNISGGAHISLPSCTEQISDRSADSMINKLLSQLDLLGSDLKGLRAKIAGGANVLDGDFSVGYQNVKSVTRKLIDERIFIAARDTGGMVSRTVRFNTQTGDLTISTSDKKTYTI